MDTVLAKTKDLQRAAIRKVLADYHRLNLRADSELESVLICDEESDNYLLLLMGWDGSVRVKTVQIHVRLKDDRLWIEEDWTEDGVVMDLIAAGVEKGAIVLGFLPLEGREVAMGQLG